MLETEKAGVGERHVAKFFPHGTATLGYDNLQVHENGLWLNDVGFIPLSA